MHCDTSVANKSQRSKAKPSFKYAIYWESHLPLCLHPRTLLELANTKAALLNANVKSTLICGNGVTQP